MKKIISANSSLMQTSGVRAKLKGLVLDHHPDVAALDIEYFHIREAWALSGDRVKVQCELDLKSGHCRVVTLVVPFTLPPETQAVYRDWTIVIKPTWYGFGYQLLDENGDVAGESSKDWGESAYAEENAKREVDRLITERLMGKAPGDSVQKRPPAAESVAPGTSEPDLEVLPASESADVAEFPAPYPGAQADQLIVRKEARSVPLPALISDASDQARWRFIEFFTATIRNRHTRRAYYNAVTQFFDWLGLGGVSSLGQITPSLVGAYIEQHPGEPPTVKQHLAAIRMLFDWLVVGQVMPANPAAAVRGPKYVVKKGKTPVLTPDQARQLLDSIDTDELIGLRDRALIAVMVYSFARVGAVTAMRVEDYFQSGKKWRFRLHEKGGKLHEVPAHHNAEEYLDAYIEAAGLWGEKKAPLFQSIRHGKPTGKKLAQADVYRMIRRRALAAGLDVDVCCHTWRATGITAYLLNGGALETAQAIANHESPRTTKLYDRTSDEITLDEVERIRI
jgi:integrase/recombinase XerD